MVDVTADPSGLAPGTAEGTLVITDTSTNYSLDVAVSISVAPLTVSPLSIDFGTLPLGATDTDTLTLTSVAGADVAWAIVIPESAADWLSVSAASGTAPANSTVTFTADPRNVDPGAYSTTVAVQYPGSEQLVTVSMEAPRPPEFVVQPGSIDLRSQRSDELVAIWNAGIGNVQWRIDTASFPVWLTLEPEDPANLSGTVLSGTVTGDETDALVLRVYRDLAEPESQIDFSYTMQFTSTIDGVATRTDVPVHMSRPLVPAMTVTADDVDNYGEAFVSFAVDEEERSFTIANTGTGVLIWSIDTSDLETWIQEVKPSQGQLDAGAEVTVAVTVDRTGLSYGSHQDTLPIASNDPDNELVPMGVEVAVEAVIEIGTLGGPIALLGSQTATSFEVANIGDPGTELNFLVSSNKEWLSVYPETGKSIGTASPIKDWQIISVAVDRAQLQGADASGKLIITAVTTEDGVTVPDTEVEAVEMTVSVNVSPLSIEAAAPRTRIPSLFRSVMLLRNIQDRAIAVPDSTLPSVLSGLSLLEGDSVVEMNETQALVLPGSVTRGNVMILLDYSESMAEAAAMVSDTSVSGAADPLQTLYEQTVTHLIDEMPSNYRVALGVFSDRVYQAGDIGGDLPYVRTITGTGPVFTDDKAELQSRLSSISVEVHGATALLPAIVEAAWTVAAQDSYLAFDDADVRALVCVTDGRLTTPPGEVTEVGDYLAALQVRPLFIGWGNNVLANPLIVLSDSAGGHYYATQGEITGERNAFGVYERIPVVSELFDWCELDGTDACDDSVGHDLDSQVLLSYVSLNESETVDVEVRLNFNDPNDQVSSCLTEQGDISGSIIHSQIPYLSVAGDPRMGQLKMRTTGGIQADGTAVVEVAADYIPRDVNSITFRFQFTLEDDLTADIALPELRILPSTEDGICPLDSFTSSGLSVVSSGVGEATVYELTIASQDGSPWPYGAFGDMFVFTFDRANDPDVLGGTVSVDEPFAVHMDVTSPEYSASNPECKFFTHPTAMVVDPEEDFLATSFPWPPSFTSPDASLVSVSPVTFDLGTTVNETELEIWNLGGSVQPHWIQYATLGSYPLGVGIYFYTSPGSQADLLGEVASESGSEEDPTAVLDRFEPASIPIVVQRNYMDVGTNTAALTVNWNWGYINMEGSEEVVFTIEALPPVVSVENTLTIATGEDSATFEVSNTGQVLLPWLIDSDLLPDGITLNASAGIAYSDPAPEDTDPSLVIVSVDRATFDFGTPSFTIEVTDVSGYSASDSIVVTVEP